MALFPDLPFIDQNDRSIQNFISKRYDEWIIYNQAQWNEASVDSRFEAGDQNIWSDYYGNIPSSSRKTFNFNRMRRIGNMIQGYQRRNRKSTTAIPIENGDQATADQFTKILMWNDQQAGIDQIISNTFYHGAVVTGMNLLEVWMDYTDDPISGDIKVGQCHYNSFIIDPYFKELDLSDCQGIWKRTYVTKEQAMVLVPSEAAMISEMQGAATRDGKFYFMPESFNYAQNNLFSYDQFWYPTMRSRKLISDLQTGESMEWTGDDEKLREFLNIWPQVEVINQKIPTINVAILIQGKVMYNGRNPLNIDTYPFVPVVGYYNPQLEYYPLRVQGVMRGLRDAQYLYNRRRVIELDILESQINSGWKYKVNALVDPKDVFLSGQGKGLALKSEANMTDVEKIQPAQIPPSMIELSGLLAKEISEISGVNEELLGSASDDKAGILAMMRQGAGLTTLQVLFDNLDRAMKILGKMRIKIIQNNFAPGKIKRILGAEPSQEFYNKNFGKYDCAVEEGFNTTTQKQLQFAQLLHLREVGVPIPNNVLVEAATIQDKGKLVEAIQQEEQQQQQMQQAQAQAQMQETEARTQLAKSRAIADQGLGIERLSRIDENRALAIERISQSQENRANARRDNNQALLNFIKSLKEIETIDLQNLEKLITLSNVMETQRDTEAPLQEAPVLNENPMQDNPVRDNPLNNTSLLERSQ